MISSCKLCPKRCGADRISGIKGICGAGNLPMIYRFGPHFGEEPPVSGQHGAGNIFFSGCPLSCVYCQNYPWSQERAGTEYDFPGLQDIMVKLFDQGCHNWNLVNATPWLPVIIQVVNQLAKNGISLPVIYNTSGYELVETLRMLENMDVIYLTDLRYSDNKTASLYSGADDYVDVARAALLEMVRQAGPLKCDDKGIAMSGVICRLLVIPGNHQQAIENLEWIAGNIGSELFISVMSQYTPAYRTKEFPEINRTVSHAEYQAVVDCAEKNGFTNGWIQAFGETVPDELLGCNMPPVTATRS